jgi:hypothetical protein
MGIGSVVWGAVMVGGYTTLKKKERSWKESDYSNWQAFQYA